jgi:hypothetical protein
VHALVASIDLRADAPQAIMLFNTKPRLRAVGIRNRGLVTESGPRPRRLRRFTRVEVVRAKVRDVDLACLMRDLGTRQADPSGVEGGLHRAERRAVGREHARLTGEVVDLDGRPRWRRRREPCHRRRVSAFRPCGYRFA